MTEPSTSTSVREQGWLEKALSALVALPMRHRPAAFVAVLLAGIAATFAATLLAKDGLAFLFGAPVVAFAAFFVATLALLFYLKADASRGLVGLFYFLPFLYALVVLGLAFMNMSREAGPISLTRPSGGAAVHSPVEVAWQPPVPALVTISKNGRTVTSSGDFVQPPYGVDLPAGDDYAVEVRSRFGVEASTSVSVVVDPSAVPLESVYRPELREEEGIELGLVIPQGFAIDAVIEVEGTEVQEIRVFGSARECDSRVKSPGGVRDLCHYFLPVLPASADVVTARVSGVAYDRVGGTHYIAHERSIRFGGILVSLNLEIGFEGEARLVEVPG